MSSIVIPVISSLGALAELGAKISRCQDFAAIAVHLHSSVKWLLPTDRVELWIGDPLVKWPGGEVAEACPTIVQAIARKATTMSVDAMVLPLIIDEGTVLGALVLRAHSVGPTALDRGICHLLALQVASAVRAVQLLERERAATKSRDRLIASLTHDLRNPLGVLASIIELTLESNPDALPAQDQDDIATSLRQMRWLIDEMLDGAKLEAGAPLTMRRQVCDFASIAKNATSAVRGSLRASHALRVEIPNERIEGNFDEPRLTRVIANLVSNAAKYSPEGGEIAIVVTRANGGVELRVSDQGIGIPAKDLPRMFERFVRASNVASINGTGIGLASSRDIVRAHGGNVTVESVEGQGSTFVVWLPS